MTKKRLPQFNDIEDMARFWDEHDSMEFEHDEIEEVKYAPKRVVLSVRFDAGDVIGLGRLARRLGTDKSTLVRMIVKQYLRSRSSTVSPDDQAATLG